MEREIVTKLIGGKTMIDERKLEEIVNDDIDKLLEMEGDSKDFLSETSSAMGLILKSGEIRKADAEFELKCEEIKKAEAERKKAELELKEKQDQIKNAAKEKKIELGLRIAEVVAIPIGTAILTILAQRGFVKMICQFEKDYTFTTSAGRSLSKLFKFGGR